MPTLQSEAGQGLLTAYKAKQDEFGNTFVQSFAAKCLRRLNDKPDDCPATLMNFIKDTSGRFVHGRSDESLDETKDRYYQQWTQRILNGEFDEEAPKIKSHSPRQRRRQSLSQNQKHQLGSTLQTSLLRLSQNLNPSITNRWIRK